jgi:protein TonB
MAIHAQTIDRTSSRSAGLVFILVLHLLLGYGLVHGIGVHTIFKDPNEALKMIFVDTTPREPKPVVKMELPTEPEVTTPELQLPEIVAPEQDVAPTDAEPPIAAMTTTPAVDAAPSTPLSINARMSPDQFYPPLSAQLGERGASVIRVCVDSSGRMAGAPTVENSSGYPRLDEAALKWAREALTFRPAMRDGVPVDACKGFRVNFKLRERTAS